MDWEQFKGYIGPIVAAICILLSAIFIAAIAAKVLPRSVENDDKKAVILLKKDLLDSLAKGRGYFYIAEVGRPRCPLVKALKEGELRSVFQRAVDAGMDLRVLVSSDYVSEQDARDFLKEVPPLKLRLSNRISKGFRVSGSFISQEKDCYSDEDAKERKLRTFPYAPRRALRVKQHFEELWATATPI